MSLTPDASRLINNAEFFREALLQIMYDQQVTPNELARMLGVDRQRINRYLRRHVKGSHTRSAMFGRYPEQFLIESMLEPADRERLLKRQVWSAKNEPWHQQSHPRRQTWG